MDPARTTRTGFLVAGVLLAPLAALEGLWPSRGTPLVTVGALGYLGAVSTALAYSLFFASLGAIRATTVSVVTLAEPLTASVIAVRAARRTPHLATGRWRGRPARRGPPARPRRTRAAPNVMIDVQTAIMRLDVQDRRDHDVRPMIAAGGQQVSGRGRGR